MPSGECKTVILLVGIDDCPLLGIAQLYGLIDAIVIYDSSVYHENAAVVRSRIHHPPLASYRAGPYFINPARMLDTLAQDLGFRIR